MSDKRALTRYAGSAGRAQAEGELKVDELIESHDMENRLGSEYSTRIFEPAKKKK